MRSDYKGLRWGTPEFKEHIRETKESAQRLHRQYEEGRISREEYADGLDALGMTWKAAMLRWAK